MSQPTTARPSLPRTATALAALILVCGSATACISPPPSVAHLQREEEVAELWEQIDADVAADHSVIVTFSGWPEAFDDAEVDQLLELELDAGKALMEAGLGYLDGNGAGSGTYDVFFYGPDCDAMWAIIEPIYASAPQPWDRVELFTGDEADAPVVLTGP